ncbi:MAG: sulfotransferase domain-containing protein [Rhodobacterales bacterium]
MKKLPQYLFDLERFGASPAKILARLNGSAANAPRILTVTMPKSGTNLLQRILVLHPALSRAWLPTLGRRNAKKWSRPREFFSPISSGKIVSSHFDFDEGLARLMSEDLGYKILLMVRDPRDAVISDIHYILTWPGHPLKDQISALPDDKARMLELIEGRNGVRNIRDQILRFSDWTKFAHTIRFEDAVGSGGGGSDSAQLSVVKDILDYIELPLTEADARSIAANARSGKTQTFRTGRIRNWETLYDQDVKDAFRAVAGDLLIELGYETGTEW